MIGRVFQSLGDAKAKAEAETLPPLVPVSSASNDAETLAEVDNAAREEPTGSEDETSSNSGGGLEGGHHHILGRPN